MIFDMKDLDIAIVGAGIAGLTAARALQTFGFRVRVYEQASRLGEVGAGLTISPNATRVLNAIGLEGVLERIGMRPTRGGVKHWRTGELLVEIPRGQDMLARYGAATTRCIAPTCTRRSPRVIQGARSGTIVLGRCFESLLDDGQRVQLRFAGGASATAAVAIGADGLRSNVRQSLFGAQQPKFTGYIAYRGLVPVSRACPRESSTRRPACRRDRAAASPLPVARRHAGQLRRSLRAPRLGRGRLVDPRQRRGSACRICRLVRGRADHHPPTPPEA